MKIPTECTLPGGNSSQFRCGNSGVRWFAWTGKYGGENFSCLCEQHKGIRLSLIRVTMFSTYDDAVAYQAMREL